MKKFIPKKSVNLSAWYNQIVLAADLADYGSAKGTMIFKPYGYAIWELIQEHMNKLIKAKGVENAYFPLFIPESLLNREKKHFKGFSPELAVVTIGGGEELKERLIVRPTSETIMYQAYSKWVQSYRDLPILINQWCNVVRWEKRTYPFLRTSEFLWQEGHTAHATHAEARAMTKWAMAMYTKTYEEYFAIPGYVGKKSRAETFPGADTSLTYEALMPSGKALQSCTSHDLGQNFSQPFNISFLDKQGKTQFAWQTSWGLSTRSIGGLILVHGDDQGLRLPPELAPVQVVVLPIKLDSKILGFCRDLFSVLDQEKIRVKVDERDDERVGYKINKWELKGVPLRLEVGEQELKTKTVTLVSRDTGKKAVVGLNNLAGQIKTVLDQIQKNLFAQAVNYLKNNTYEINDYSLFKKQMNGDKGFLKAFWCGNPKCETMIKAETKATTRCLPPAAKKEKGKCIYCQKAAGYRWYFAQAY